MAFNQYKSEGERIIAEFLESINMPYRYEPGVLIRDKGYQRIWYPDFKLRDYSIYLEYFGMENNPFYDSGIRHKLATYQDNTIDVIPVYPKTLQTDFGSYLLDEIYLSLHSQLTGLERIAGEYRTNNTHNHRSSTNYNRPFRRYH